MGSSGVLTINLSAVQANWRMLRDRAADGVDTAAVIKANAYGLGVHKVGRALHAIGCREFFFANVAEALAFKSYDLNDVKIYVLGGIRAGDEHHFIDNQFIPVLFSYDSVLRWASVCEEVGNPFPCALKINTGMTRLGLGVDEFESLCGDPALLKKIHPVVVMSHLACADEPTHSLNSEQLMQFSRCVDLAKISIPNIRYSLANSSGIFLGSEWHFDVLRPGAALYGINPVPEMPNPLNPVIHLALPILQIRRLTSASTIGYGAGVELPANSRVAVVAGGYADGLHRTLGLQPEGILCGRRIKSVGRMSMDLTIFDISDIDLPDDELMLQSVDVINDELSLDYLMRKNSTLGYDILTSLGHRYKRVYVGG